MQPSAGAARVRALLRAAIEEEGVQHPTVLSRYARLLTVNQNPPPAVVDVASPPARPPPPPLLPRTNRTSLVPPLVLSGHTASLTPY